MTKICRLRVLWLVALVILIGLLVGYCSSPGADRVLVPADGSKAQSDSSPSHAVVTGGSATAAFLDAFKTSIQLYGKVVDQHGDPVPGATVRLFPVDAPFGDDSKSKMTMVSDKDGRFSVKGLHGFSLGVQVSKEGYLHLSPLGGPSSSASISYAHGAKRGKRCSHPETPLVLQLHKVGPIEPMVYVKEKRWRLPVDGSLRLVALDSEGGRGEHQIEFRFNSDWSKLPMDNEINSKLFDWSFEARIPGGGFVWNDSDYNFEAPESGYKESIRYDYPASLPRDKWKRFQNGRYFVIFPDGSHARIRLDIDGASDRRPLAMTSWLSLKPGSRNLASPQKDGSGFHGGDPEKE